MRSYLVIALLLFLANSKAQDSTILQPAQMQRDLGILKAAFQQLHPGIYRYNDSVGVERVFQAAMNSANAPLSYREFYLLLARLANEVKCAHTYLNPYNQKSRVRNMLYKGRLFPFLFTISENKMIVTHNMLPRTKLQAGSEITHINSIPIKNIFDTLYSYSRADGINGINKKIANTKLTTKAIDSSYYAFFDIYFAMLFNPNNSSAITINFTDCNSIAAKESISLVTKSERQKLYFDIYDKYVKLAPWSYKFLNTSTGYLRIKSFVSWDGSFNYKLYLDSLVRALNTEGKIKDLIIDIRDNEGGDSEASDELLSYLTDKPLGCDKSFQRFYRYKSIADSLKPFLSTWDNSFKETKSDSLFVIQKNGLYLDIRNRDCQPITKKQVYRGKSWLVTDGSNSSTSFFLADKYQQIKAGKIVGEKSGGSKQGINGGEFFFLYLPASGIEVDIPLVYQTFGERRKDEGIDPDHSVSNSQQDNCKGNDPAIEYILTKTSKR